MVISEATSKDRRRSSVSPIRERVRRKPRQDWLVTVGQGHSPARTLRRESRGRRNSKSPRTKKFDSARLSFGGLEQDRKPSRSQSPPPASGDGASPPSPSLLVTPPHSSRLRVKRPSLSPSSAASPKQHAPSAIATSPMVVVPGDSSVVSAQTDDTTVGLSGSPHGSSRGSGGGGGSPFRRPRALEPSSSPLPSVSTAVAGNGPRTDWLSTAVARRAAGPGSNRNSSHGGGAGEGGADASSTTSDRNGGADCGGEAPGLAAGEGDAVRDVKLSSLLLLSPGKEYWAGRLAAQGRRGSESPRAAAGRNKSRLNNNNNNNAFGDDEIDVSSTPPRESDAPTSPATAAEPNNDNAPSDPTGCRQPQQRDTTAALLGGSSAGKKDYFYFTTGKRGAPLSPSGSSASSVWSTQAFTSPGGGGGGGGGGTASLGGGTGRVDLSPWRSSLQKGEAWSPSSPLSTSASLSPARGQRRRGFSPGGAPRFGSAAAIAASLQAAKRDRGAFSPSPSPAGGGGRDFGTASSAPFSPGKGSLGVGFEGRSRSASPPRSKETLDSRLASPSGRSSDGTGRLVASGRFTSPSSLPVVEAGAGGGDGGACVAVDNTDCPERTTAARLSSSKSESPERTGEDTASDDGCTGGGGGDGGDGGGGDGFATAGVAPSELFKKEDAGRGSAGGGLSGGAAWPEAEDLEETKEVTLLSPVEAGAGGDDLLSPAARPSPLRPQLYSPFAQEPSPSTGQDHHLEGFAVTEEAVTEPPSSSLSAPPVATLGSSAAWTATAATVAGDSRPPLHGNGAGFRGHAPPGVCVVETTPTAAASTLPTSTATANSTATASASDVSGSTGGSSSGSGKSREDAVRSSAGGSAAAVPTPRSSYQGEGTGAAPGEAKLRVCTPTGDGGASDLSLWVTLRNLEEEEREGKAAGGGARRPFLSLSPVTAGHPKDSVGGGRFSSTSAVSLGGAAKRESEDAVEREEENGGGEGGDGAVGFLSSNEDVETNIDERFSDTAPLLAASVRDADQGQTGGGKGAGTGTSTRITVPPVSAATDKTGPTEGSRSSVVDRCDVGPVPVDAGGVGGLWRSLSQAVCGLFNFCHPHQGSRGGADWCR